MKGSRLLLLAAIFGTGTYAAVATASGALAANQSVNATGSGCTGSLGWNGQAHLTVNINPGDSVTWTDCMAGYHQLQSTSPGWCLAQNQTSGSPGSATGWTYTCRFATSGSFTFQCSIHTTSMDGTIVVAGSQPPPQTPAPAPTHSQAPPPPPAPANSTAPAAAPAGGGGGTAASPTPPTASPTPAQQALAPSPSPSPSPSLSPGPTSVGSTSPTGSGGSGLPVPLLLGGGMVVIAAGGGTWYWRRRQGAG